MAIKENLLEVLNNVIGTGKYHAEGVVDFVMPGLQINDGEILTFPLSIDTVKKMITNAQKAPFGKGSATVYDSNVRSAWEIDKQQIQFHNPKWQTLIVKILKSIKTGLGLSENDISANLYKLLIYEKGDFFLAHKDSEKEPGMFGTLIINLPSEHTGGELNISFDGQNHTTNFAQMGSAYTLPYAAFYADCTHEVKPLTSGYRVCLVYNLVQEKSEPKIVIKENQKYVNEILKHLKTAKFDKPQILLLGHQYTPQNFSLDTLKLNDKLRSEIFIEAANQAGFFANLGLLTCYQMGELQGDFEYNRYNRNDYSDGVMGEIYEETTKISHWADGELPKLNLNNIFINQIISDFEIMDGDPIEEEEEGYTGNAGMTMEYWYHYGAIIFWPKTIQFEILKTQPIEIILDWMGYYLKNKQKANVYDLLHYIELPENLFRPTLIFDNYGLALIELGDEKLLKKEPFQLILKTVFAQISVPVWIKLFETYPSDLFNPVLEDLSPIGLDHFCHILQQLQSNPEFSDYVINNLLAIPKKLEKLNQSNLHENNSNRISILHSLVQFEELMSKNTDWYYEISQSFTFNLTRKYVNKTLLPNINTKDSAIGILIGLVCKNDLQERVKNKPVIPEDWKRKTHQSKQNIELWNLLNAFLASPNQSELEIRRLQSERNAIINIINNAEVDLKTEVIKKGSPHLLLVTKTYASFKKNLKNWKEDVELLNEYFG